MITKSSYDLNRNVLLAELETFQKRVCEFVSQRTDSEKSLKGNPLNRKKKKYSSSQRKCPCSSVKGLARACPPMITLVGQVARPPAATTHQHAAQPFQSPQT